MTHEDFCNFVAKWIFEYDDDDEFNALDGAFCEIACRKLCRLGIVTKTEDGRCWHYDRESREAMEEYEDDPDDYWYSRGLKTGRNKAIELVLDVIETAQTYKLYRGDTDTYIDKRALREAVEALKEVSNGETDN